MEVSDARETDQKIRMEDHGFRLIQHVSNCPLEAQHFETVGGDRKVLMQYLEETIELVRGELDATQVVCFGWRVCDERVALPL